MNTSLGRLVEHVGGRTLLVFSHFWFNEEFKGRMKDAVSFPMTRKRQSVLTVREACLITTLVALRDLDDCLARGRRDGDDREVLRARDWGYRAGAVLSKSERKDVNTRVVHSTTLALECEPKALLFDVRELTVKGARQGLGFLEWVEKVYGPKRDSHAWTGARQYQSTIRSTLEHAEKVWSGADDS